MNNVNSFMYTISSTNRSNFLDECNDCTLIIGPIYSNSSKWYVQCSTFLITANLLTDPPEFVHLVADDWSINGVSIGLSSNQLIIGTLQTNINIAAMVSGNGYHFIVENMTTPQAIRFRLYNPDLSPVSDDVTSLGSEWSISLLFTPID
jgi:hypothetical protein